MIEKISRMRTLPGLASPGPHPGARPGVGARRRAPGGRVFAHGTRPGTARRSDVGPPSSESRKGRCRVIWVAVVGGGLGDPIPGW